MRHAKDVGMLYKKAGICVFSPNGPYHCQLNLLISVISKSFLLLILNTHIEWCYMYCRVGRISIIPANFPDISFLNVECTLFYWLKIFVRFNKLNLLLFSGPPNWQTYQCPAETGETLSKGICILPSVCHYFHLF